MVYASTINDSTMLSGDGAARVKVHMGHVGLGIGVLVFSMFFPYRRWKTLVYPKSPRNGGPTGPRHAFW